MAVDLMGYPKMNDQMAMQEAATAGIRGMEHFIFQMGEQKSSVDCREIADHTVSNFKKMISIMNRTGHARFRRGPNHPPQPQAQILTLDFTNPKIEKSSFLSSVTGDGSVSNGKNRSSLLPPLHPSSSHKKRCESHGSLSSSGGRCHCSKKRKSRVKRRTIRVAAISSKMADIPSDEFSWRKYGQKPIKGSPYPRAYYKCSSVRGCPARKHVERDPDEPSMLIVTYEGDHRHSFTPLPGALRPSQ